VRQTKPETENPSATAQGLSLSNGRIAESGDETLARFSVEKKRNPLWLVGALAFLSFAALVFAQDAVPKPNSAPMDLLGMGPEMFADRASAWVEATGNVAEKAIGKIGVLVAAIYLVKKNLGKNKELEARVDRTNERVQQNSDRVHEVAMAVQVQPVPKSDPFPQ
jgi:hypothetical protein